MGRKKLSAPRYDSGVIKQRRKNIAILPKLYDALDEIQLKEGVTKVFIADIAILEYLKKKGINVDLSK